MVKITNERQKSDGSHGTKAINLDQVNGRVYHNGKHPRHIDRRADKQREEGGKSGNEGDDEKRVQVYLIFQEFM